MKAIGKYVIVDPETIEQTASGLYLASTKEKTIGTVISSGPDVIKAGDRVVYSTPSPTTPRTAEGYLILLESEILAIIES